MSLQKPCDTWCHTVFLWPPKITPANIASTMYLRYHYGAGVIAGLIWAGAVGWFIRQRRDIVTFTTNQAMVS